MSVYLYSSLIIFGGVLAIGDVLTPQLLSGCAPVVGAGVFGNCLLLCCSGRSTAAELTARLRGQDKVPPLLPASTPPPAAT